MRSARTPRRTSGGFKEVGIPLDEMKELYSYMKQCGKTTFLEVVAYTEEECMEGAKMGCCLWRRLPAGNPVL